MAKLDPEKLQAGLQVILHKHYPNTAYGKAAHHLTHALISCVWSHSTQAPFGPGEITLSYQGIRELAKHYYKGDPEPSSEAVLPSVGDWIFVKVFNGDDPGTDIVEYVELSKNGSLVPSTVHTHECIPIATYLGVVTSIQGSTGPNKQGGFPYGHITIQTESFFDFMFRANIALSPTHEAGTSIQGQSTFLEEIRTNKPVQMYRHPQDPGEGTYGTLFNQSDWVQRINAALDNYTKSVDAHTGGPLGGLFSDIYKIVGKILLPSTLVDWESVPDFGTASKLNKYLNRYVRTVHDAQSQRSTGQFVLSQGVSTYTQDEPLVIGRTGPATSKELALEAGGVGPIKESKYSVVQRKTVPVPGFAFLGLDTINFHERTVAGVLLGTFLADPNLLEMFPTMEFAPRINIKDGIVKAVGDPMSGWRPALHYRVKNIQPESLAKFANRPNSMINQVGSKPSSYSILETAGNFTQDIIKGGGKYLSEQDVEKVLSDHNKADTYRDVMKQGWSTGKIEKWVIRLAFIHERNLDHGLLRGIFDNPNFGEENGDVEHYFGARDCLGWTWKSEDSTTVNAVTHKFVNDPMGSIQYNRIYWGLPFMAPQAVDVFGMRVFKPTWPWWTFPNSGEAPKTESELTKLNQEVLKGRTTDHLRAYLRSVALFGLQIMGNTARFFTGSLQLRYRPQIQAGTAIRGPVTYAGHHSDTPSFVSSELASSGNLRAYVTMVRHRVAVAEDGTTTRYTDVQYERGLVGEDTNQLRFVPYTVELTEN